MKKLFILSILCLLLPLSTWAATVAVRIDTGSVSVNAVEASIQLPAGATVSSISTGDSAILFWLQEPRVANAVISFSGITPGGFSGKHALLTISGDFASTTKLSFEGVSALKNDGAGTPVQVSLSTVPVEIASDTTPPESFALSISSSMQIFDGRPFLVFQTQDKGVGVDHYDVAMTWFLSPGNADWHVAKSPLVLDSLHKRIFVRAVDGAGNVRVESLASAEYKRWWALIAGFGILIVLLSVIFVRFACSKRAP